MASLEAIFEIEIDRSFRSSSPRPCEVQWATLLFPKDGLLAAILEIEIDCYLNPSVKCSGIDTLETSENSLRRGLSHKFEN